MQSERDSSSDTASSASPLHTAPRILGNAFQKIWTHLIFRDHWQGEFSIALFGGIGFALLMIFSPYHAFDDERYRILDQIMPEVMWKVAFIGAGATQLYGLYSRSKWYRLAGATLLFIGLVCVVESILLTAPWQLSLAMYAACIFIELCAIIFQTACIIRLREYPRWCKWIFRL